MDKTSQSTAPLVHHAIEQTMRQDRGRILAGLSASLGNFSLAEDCLQDAITTALDKWSNQGVPDAPSAWLFQVARRQAIDVLRRTKSFDAKSVELTLRQSEIEAERDMPIEIPDHRLGLIFTCCHPALDPKLQVALTLHTLGGLSTAEVARGFLVKTPTMAARLTRAKAKIKTAGIPFAIPDQDLRKSRISAVLRVIYLIYNEGYSATQGADQLRIDLCEEAMFLAQLMVNLCPKDAEPMGLLALILFSHARKDARRSSSDGYVSLENQDRNLWDQSMIETAQQLLEQALPMGSLGPYQLQAAIHGVHCAAKTAAQTDWDQITSLYQVLLRIEPSPVIELNFAVALAFAGKLDKASRILTRLGPELDGYQPFHAAKADISLRTGEIGPAITAFDRAIDLSNVDSEKAFLRECLKKARRQMQ